MLQEDTISGREICLVLYDQGILSKDDGMYDSLASGAMTAYDFMVNKIYTLEIEPAQLALEPCSASAVITDVKTGDVLACVSYPGYNNNLLVNDMDTDYYAKLSMDQSSPFFNLSLIHILKHYLVDELLPEEEFHIVKFQQMAKAAMEEIYAKGKVPILVGGTGFYIQAVTKDIDFTQAEQEDGYRRELEQLAAEKGNDYLHTMLQEVDPVSAKEIHANNVKRVIRALEFYHQNQSPISAHNQEQKEHETPYNLAYFVLNVPRELLYKRIDDRIDEMLEEGLLEEVEQLKKRGCHRGMVSMQGLGYKEILAYLEGEYPLEEAVRVLKRDTRHFAKRQLTWFRREKETIWINKNEFDYNEDLILERMVEICKDKKILDEQMKDKNIK